MCMHTWSCMELRPHCKKCGELMYDLEDQG